MNPRRRIRGCWTCKLRRKRCDGEDPCGECQSLGIECCFQINKPAWMDRGAEQRQKTDELKLQIRSNATQRRTMSKVQTLSQRPTGATPVAHNLTPQLSTTEYDAQTPSPSSADERARTTGSIISSISTAPSSAPTQRAASGVSSTPQAAYAQDLLDGVLLMAYLDWLFPIMYPFYRPTIVEGGRCWILPTVHHSTCIRSGVIALSSHMMGRLQASGGSSTQLCEALDARYLHEQTQAALQSAQQDLMAVRSKETRSVVESSKLFCSVVQLLTTEAHLSNDAKVHLDAAVSIFRHLVHGFDNNDGVGEEFAMIVQELGAVFILQRPDLPIYTPDQASFRFYAANLIFADCIASTATGQEPQLHQYSIQVLKNSVEGMTSSKLDLAEIFGVHNETLLIISSIATLAAWKQKMTDSHQLSMLELVAKANMLHVLLQSNFDKLQSESQGIDRRVFVPLDSLSGLSPVGKRSIDTVRRLWALAARVYLFVTTSGAQLSNASLRADISDMIALLETIADQELSQISAWLRALSWPVCVAGLLVESAQEKQFLRRLFRSLDTLASFATVGRLKATVEGVWDQRDSQTDVSGSDQSLALLMGGVLLI